MADMTSIEVPKALRDRLRQVAISRGITLAQAIGYLLDTAESRPRPTVGGYRSYRAQSAEDIDRALGRGFGA